MIWASIALPLLYPYINTRFLLFPYYVIGRTLNEFKTIFKIRSMKTSCKSGGISAGIFQQAISRLRADYSNCHPLRRNPNIRLRQVFARLYEVLTLRWNELEWEGGPGTRITRRWTWPQPTPLHVTNYHCRLVFSQPSKHINHAAAN